MLAGAAETYQCPATGPRPSTTARGRCDTPDDTRRLPSSVRPLSWRWALNLSTWPGHVALGRVGAAGAEHVAFVRERPAARVGPDPRKDRRAAVLSAGPGPSQPKPAEPV
jgi:hypothetical protein